MNEETAEKPRRYPGSTDAQLAGICQVSIHCQQHNRGDLATKDEFDSVVVRARDRFAFLAVIRDMHQTHLIDFHADLSKTHAFLSRRH
jgi:hypothetical protein